MCVRHSFIHGRDLRERESPPAPWVAGCLSALRTLPFEVRAALYAIALFTRSKLIQSLRHVRCNNHSRPEITVLPHRIHRNDHD